MTLSPLTLNAYQTQALDICGYPKEHRLTYPAIGLAGETGEVCEKVKRIIREHGGSLNNDAAREIAMELGDVLWYVAAIARDLGFSLECVAELNIAKLNHRFAAGTINGKGDNR